MGDWPAWIAAVATVGALIFAAIAAWASWQVLKREAQRDENRAEAERRSQANLVAAWRGIVPSVRQRGIGVYRAVVRNGSELPIYQVEVDILVPGSTAVVHKTEALAPGQWFVTKPAGDFYPVDHPAEKLRVHDPSNDDFRVAVTFRDAAGNVWRRDEQGNLRQTGRVAFAQVATATGAAEGATAETDTGD